MPLYHAESLLDCFAMTAGSVAQKLKAQRLGAACSSAAVQGNDIIPGGADEMGQGRAGEQGETDNSAQDRAAKANATQVRGLQMHFECET